MIKNAKITLKKINSEGVLIMKKLFGLVLSGILMISMVGCTDSVEEQVEEQEPPAVEEPKEDEYVEPEEVIEEPEVTK